MILSCNEEERNWFLSAGQPCYSKEKSTLSCFPSQWVGRARERAAELCEIADSPLPHSDQKPLAYQFMNQAAPERAAELCEMADSPLPHSDQKPLAYQFMNRNNHCGVYVECIMYWYYTINLKNEHGSGYRRCRNSISFNPTKPTGFGSTRTSPAGFTVRFGTYWW